MVRLTLLLTLLLAAPAGATHVTVGAPADGAAVQLHRHFTGLAGSVALRGRAAKRSVVHVQAQCTLGPCTTTAVADRKGRWKAALHVVVPAGRGTLGIRATYPADPAGGEVITVALPEPPPFAAPGGPHVGVIGDSLAVGTEPLLGSLLPEARVSTDGRVSRPLAEGMAVFDRTPLPPAPFVAVLGLFTNDDPRNLPALDAAVRRSVQRVAAAGGCAVWLTIARPKVRGVSYRAVNERLLALAEDPALSGALVVADWAEAVRGRRGWMRKDRVHPTDRGYEERAALIAAAARDCLNSP